MRVHLTTLYNLYNWKFNSVCNRRGFSGPLLPLRVNGALPGASHADRPSLVSPRPASVRQYRPPSCMPNGQPGCTCVRFKYVETPPRLDGAEAPAVPLRLPGIAGQKPGGDGFQAHRQGRGGGGGTGKAGARDWSG